jgi:multidrug efflux pump subunit AcrB
LAIGLVVDDAIVVVEGVERHIEEGMTPKNAALQAMEELSAPVVGIALVLSAVFVPTAFIPGITGKLYQQFAVTIAISVLLSAFNALTLSPALAALLLKPKKPSTGLLRGFFDWFNRVFDRATDGYVRWSAVLVKKNHRGRRNAGGLFLGRGLLRATCSHQFSSRRRSRLRLRQRQAKRQSQRRLPHHPGLHGRLLHSSTPPASFDYSGMSFQEQKARQGVPPAAIFGVSLLFVFLILAALYESWSLPFSVLLSGCA